jgi:predicted ATPase/DNA-binding CsgD family transcriptional regulator
MTVQQQSVNLPVFLTPLVGREHEVAAVASLLKRADVRVLTLTGPGGVGKTRLAVRIAADIAADFADAAAFVPLAPVRDPELVAPTIAQVLGVPESGRTSIDEGLKARLRHAELLLVLDNFEQVLPAAPAIADLLAGCPLLKVLVTSRAVLRLYGEWDFPVPPLPLPAVAPSGGDGAAPVERIADAPAVRLFCDRAQAVKPGFTLDQGNAGAVAEIVRRLDGLPLAIELAAPRLSLFPPVALVARLERRLPLLTRGSRDQPARHQALRDAIAWSYDLLTPDEQKCFRRLAVFVGGCTVEAAEAVLEAGGQTSHETIEGIASLVANSLVQQVAGPDGEARFATLETIREFGLEQLAASGEEAAVRGYHAAWFRELAAIGDTAFWGGEQGPWLARLEVEHANFRAALAWFLDTGEYESALRLAGDLFPFWYVHNHLAEGRVSLDRALAVGGATAARANALAVASALAHQQADIPAAISLADESAALWREIGSGGRGPAMATCQQGIARHWQGGLDEAEAYYNASLALYRAVGDLGWSAQILANLAHVAYLRGDDARAKALAEEALAMQLAAGNRFGAAFTLSVLGDLAVDQGRHEDARAHYCASLEIASSYRDRWRIADCLSGLGIVAAAGDRPRRAVQLLGAAAAIRHSIGQPIPSWNRGRNERIDAELRQRLDENAFDDAWAAGRALPTETAIAEAIAPVADEDPATDAWESTLVGTTGLSARELQVVRLVASGQTDREIAEALFLSPRTINTHTARIYAKLGVGSRAEAAAWAVRHGLT